MHLDRDKGCHGDAAWSSGSVLWLCSEISHLQHKSLENGFVLCLSVLCCDCWVRFPIHDIGSPGFVCVKQSLRMWGWVAIVEAAVLLQYSTTSAFCNLWCYLHMFEDLRGWCGRTRPAIWYALQALPKQKAKHLEQLFHRCSSLWFVFMLKKTFRICLNPPYTHSPEVFIYYQNLSLKNKHCQRHYGPRRWLLWPVILVW